MIARKTLILMIIATLWSVLLLSGCSKNQWKGKVQADFELGYDGTIKVSADNPLKAVIRNDGPAIKGELQVVVNDTAYSKIIIAMPFEIAEESEKEIRMDVPVYLIQKEFEVSIVTRGDKVYKERLKINKVLSPEKNVIAVITDTPDTYRFIENATITANINQNYNMYVNYYGKQQMATATEGGPVEASKLEVFYFDSLEDLHTLGRLNFFNFILIGQNQSLDITEEEASVLREWLERGNGLITDIGADYQKMKAILPESLYPVEITGTYSGTLPSEYSTTPLNQPVELATAIVKEGTTLYGDINSENNLFARTKVGAGTILTLLMNLGTDPIATWSGRTSLISTVMSSGFALDENSYYVDPNYNPYQYLVSDIPTEKEPPYLFMIFLFVGYILIVAPILYIILKKADKRDLAWIFIPVLSIGCVVILLIVGAGTRYQKPIFNTFSVLTADESTGVMTVNSNIAIFSDLKDKLSIEWNQEDSFKMTSDYMDPYMMYNPDPETNPNKELVGKLTLGATPKMEIYDTSLWEANYATAAKTIPFEYKPLVSLRIEGDVLKLQVKNTMPYDLKYAFVKWGNFNIPLGDLSAGEEKVVEKNLAEMNNDTPEKFFQDLIGYTPNYTNYRFTKEEIKLQQMLDVFLQRYVYNNNNSYYAQIPYTSDLSNVKLCGMNNQNVGYDILVNGEEPEVFSRNIIEVSSTLQLEPGTEISLPAQMLLPRIDYALDQNGTMGAYNYQPYDNYVFYYDRGTATYEYKVPSMISVERLSVEFSDVYSESDYYNFGVGMAGTPLLGATYTAYNYKTQMYDEIARSSDISSDYVSEEGTIVLQANFANLETDNGLISKESGYSTAVVSLLPSLMVEGRVK